MNYQQIKTFAKDSPEVIALIIITVILNIVLYNVFSLFIGIASIYMLLRPHKIPRVIGVALAIMSIFFSLMMLGYSSSTNQQDKLDKTNQELSDLKTTNNSMQSQIDMLTKGFGPETTDLLQHYLKCMVPIGIDTSTPPKYITIYNQSSKNITVTNIRLDLGQNLYFYYPTSYDGKGLGSFDIEHSKDKEIDIKEFVDDVSKLSRMHYDTKSFTLYGVIITVTAKIDGKDVQVEINRPAGDGYRLSRALWCGSNNF